MRGSENSVATVLGETQQNASPYGGLISGRQSMQIANAGYETIEAVETSTDMAYDTPLQRPLTHAVSCLLWAITGMLIRSEVKPFVSVCFCRCCMILYVACVVTGKARSPTGVAWPKCPRSRKDGIHGVDPCSPRGRDGSWTPPDILALEKSSTRVLRDEH